MNRAGRENVRKAETWQEKPCDVCREATALRTLGVRRFEVSTSAGSAEILQEDTLCESCGFLFAGRVPDAPFLAGYYREAHTLRSDFRDVAADFDPDARFDLLRRYATPGSSILEIGAHDGTFCASLRAAGFDALGLDPLQGAPEGLVVRSVPDGVRSSTLAQRFKTVVAYYVLEHLADPRAWLGKARSYLEPDGLLIIEVPDFAQYPVESLYHEHLLHFTPFHLEWLLHNSGFDVLECAVAAPSRYFGFQTAARRVERDGGAVASAPHETRERVALACDMYAEAVSAQERERERERELGAHLGLRASSARTYFWAANTYATRIARELRKAAPDAEVHIVDSSASKIGTCHEGFPRPIEAPTAARYAPAHSTFVLCSPSWNDDIKQQIDEMQLDEFRVVDGVRWRSSSQR